MKSKWLAAAACLWILAANLLFYRQFLEPAQRHWRHLIARGNR